MMNLQKKTKRRRRRRNPNILRDLKALLLSGEAGESCSSSKPLVFHLKLRILIQLLDVVFLGYFKCLS
ncbi:hypothetical protein V6Z12_D11G144100 [Gossypium hirsutum]